MKYVIARYKEDISWANKLSHHIVQKGVDMPNVGREPASYFYFIIANYHKLHGEYKFVQGNPFDHCADILSSNERYYGHWHISDINGCPDHCGLPIQEVLTALSLTGEVFKFKAGCQFKVSAEKIKERPIEFYLNCFALCCMDDRYPYVFERIVPLIFDLS